MISQGVVKYEVIDKVIEFRRKSALREGHEKERMKYSYNMIKGLRMDMKIEA